MQRESGYRADVVSDAGAVGLMQVLPDTFERLRPQVEHLLGRRADVRHPLDNLVAGAVLYRQHLDHTNGDVEQAARLYHGGTDLAHHVPRTQMYGRGIVDRYRQLAAAGS